MNDEAILDDGKPKREIYALSWEEMTYVTSRLVEQIRADGCPQIIVGLQRGGLVPAVMLSHQLEVQGFLTVPVTHGMRNELLTGSEQA